MSTFKQTYYAQRAWSAAALLLAAALALSAAACGEEGGYCGPGTCKGCCDARGACVPGGTLTTCGGGGGACDTCAAGQRCAAGLCVSACGPQTCPNGCCLGDLCVAGTNNDVCGGGGTACTHCSGGQSCAQQRCVASSGCDETTCPGGCCEGAQCRPGVTDLACGAGSAPCAVCPKGAHCVNQQCYGGDGVSDACNAATCPDGCCAGATCRPGNTKAFCGVGGDLCAACPGAATCANKQCTSAPTNEWKVTVVSAAIRSLVNGGKDWDHGALAGFEPPDVYVKVTSGGKTKKTKTRDNTYLPVFNEQTISVNAQELAKAVKVEIWDKDLLPPDQLMGACTVTFPGFILLKGGYTKLYCGSPEVINVKFAFAPK